EIDAAHDLARRLDPAIASLATLSERGRVVPELRRHGIVAYRELVVGTFRVVYRVTPRVVRVVAIIDGRRDLDELLFERVRREPDHSSRTRGSSHAYTRSTTRFAITIAIAVTSVTPRISGMSRSRMACSTSRPSPGHANTVSVTTAPPISTPRSRPTSVTTGPSALRR